MKLERLKEGIKADSDSSEEENDGETETESEIEVTFNTSAGSSKLDTSDGDHMTTTHVTRDHGEASENESSSKDTEKQGSEFKTRVTDEKTRSQADKIKISSRKRVNSETVPGLVVLYVLN